ncbi:uncharacterized protein BXZ73DRAFT_53002, partial [Epithele typhae]|uniref:uncharacterized protein n=1 Tax=Epithele typhae TaxID=378194 RepID=UPI002007EF6C
WAPQAYMYAVARIDPVSMVQHLNDPFALEAAKQMALRTKTYLIYINQCLALPLGIERWFLFKVTGIATSPPPPCEAECRGPETSVPLFPNDAHPTGREPLKTDPSPFPFHDCFHWPLKAMPIRVLPRPDGWNRSRAIRLTGASQVLMSFYWQEDGLRCRKLLRARRRKEKEALSAGALRERVEDSAPDAPSLRGDILEGTFTNKFRF